LPVDKLIGRQAEKEFDMTVFEGKLNGEGMHIGIVVARFNEFITAKLLDGALDGLKRLGVADTDIDTLWVPGAYEIPLATQKMIATKKYDGIIALGAVIRGSTAHFEYVCQQVNSGLGNVILSTSTPVMFGVLTTDTVEQAMDRAGIKSGNKGFECAQGVIEMIDAFRQLEK
jgi:6,7-dimethyl-8-ribityllumazine synthase